MTLTGSMGLPRLIGAHQDHMLAGVAGLTWIIRLKGRIGCIRLVRPTHGAHEAHMVRAAHRAHGANAACSSHRITRLRRLLTRRAHRDHPAQTAERARKVHMRPTQLVGTTQLIGLVSIRRIRIARILASSWH